MLKRLLACILVFSWTHLLFGTVYAAEPAKPPFLSPQYTHISEVDGAFNIQDGYASCFGGARSRYADTMTTVKITLMQCADGEVNWSNVCSWQSQSHGKVYTYVDEQIQVNSGFDYQILVQCTISDSEGVVLETDSMYSQIISY